MGFPRIPFTKFGLESVGSACEKLDAIGWILLTSLSDGVAEGSEFPSRKTGCCSLVGESFKRLLAGDYPHTQQEHTLPGEILARKGLFGQPIGYRVRNYDGSVADINANPSLGSLATG